MRASVGMGSARVAAAWQCAGLAPQHAGLAPGLPSRACRPAPHLGQAHAAAAATGGGLDHDGEANLVGHLRLDCGGNAGRPSVVFDTFD